MPDGGTPPCGMGGPPPPPMPDGTLNKFNQIFYLNVNVREDNMHYYVDENIYNYKNEFDSKKILFQIFL
jgi:hypothetical protein